MTVELCNDKDPLQLWEPGPFGEIVNAAFGMCLTDRNDGKAGSAVVQYDCYGNAGQNWGVN